ncbi:MAG TPA: hypothetical protein VNL77_25030, partial [Roseiflexaceae bacterium]|nr:hypothetical protein [Roseiflexaceae bacterium]
MDPNDQPPDESSPRTLTIRLTRDTLILLAAMVFLAIAILLAVLFPSGGGEPGEVAQATPPATRTAAVAQATAIVVPAATQPPPGLTPSPVEVAPTQAYP